MGCEGHAAKTETQTDEYGSLFFNKKN